jgi:uncharacterized protein (DUF488 family)
MTITRTIITIGAYGYDENGFFAALQAARVDLLLDIRRRRAVRGGQFAFANSQRLQNGLAALGIGYQHRLELAPGPVTRQIQEIHDRTTKTPRRQRQTLSPAFVDAYWAECLVHFDPQALLRELGPNVRTLAFFCVEREPTACHRSLVAARFAALGLPVIHLTP